MKKLLRYCVAIACAGAFFIQFDASAAPMKKRGVYKYGDAMGAAPTDVWSNYNHNFYDKNGKAIRSVQLYRDPTGASIIISAKTENIYDEQGRMIHSVNYEAYATSAENKDQEYAFKYKNRMNYEYNESGQLVCQWQQKWSEKNGEWDTMYKTYYTEYSYNADGTKAEERYWTNYYAAKPVDPVVTKYVYDGQGKNPVKTVTTGKYDSNWYDTEFTYDTQGRCTHSITTYTKEGYSKKGQIKEEKEWVYDGDFLSAVITLSKTPNVRTHYVKIDNDPNHYFEYNETYNEEKSEWTQSKPTFNEHVIQDYAGMENLVPELSATISADNAQDVNIKFSLPTISAEAYAVKVYRDGAEIKSYTKDELTAIYDGSKYYSFTDGGLTNGEHEYYAQVLTGTAAQTIDQYAEGYISDIVKAEAKIPYPEVTDFHIKGYTYNKTWVDPQKDDEGNTIEGYWQEDYKLVLEWTPLTEQQVADYGFERYEIYYNSIAGDTPVDEYTDITTGTATVDWMSRYTEVWLNVKYGKDRVSTEHIAINLDELTNLSETDPIPAYGVYYKGGYTPAFAKVDLTKPEEAVEEVYDVYADSQADWSAIFGGVTVGDTYYALFEDNNADGLGFGAFNMTDKKYMKIGQPFTGTVESKFSDMAYDMAADKLYAVAPTATASYLYAIDRTTGEAVKTDIALPEYTMYIASANEGKAYAMVAETGGKFQLYSVDLNAGTCAKVEGVSVAGTSNKWSSLLCMGNELYFNVNKTYYTINLDKKSVTTNNDFKFAMSGLTPTKSTALPEIGFTLSEDAHKITTEESGEGTVSYFYNADNAVARVAEFDADGKMTKYTKNIFNEQGAMTSTEVYEPKADAYGVESMQVAASSTYTYDAAGLLTEKKNSDNSWVRYTYTDGKVATEAYGNGETTEQTLTYMYDEDQQPDGQVIMIQSASEGNPDLNYIEAYRYDEMGNKVALARAKDMMGGAYTAMETWEYFPNTNLMSAHNICSPTEFTQDGQPVVLSSTKYMMVDNDPNHLMSQEFDGENPVEGSAKNLVYSNLEGTAKKSAITVTATAVEGSVNEVSVAYTLPSMAYSEPYSISIYRDGKLLQKINSGEISATEFGKYVYTDKMVPNGKHEYYARANAFGINDIDVPLQISGIADLALDTELPAVSNIAFVKYEEKAAGAESTVAENDTESTPAYVVTIGWKNPEKTADYGFTGNHLFLMEGTTPTAAGVVTDATVAETTVNVGNATTFDIMIQSRYTLGTANSDTQKITFSTVGVESVGEDGFTVKVADKQAVASQEATISVFDMTGARVATAYGERLDLSALNGAYIVTAERDGAVRIVKVVL